ncbi:hypothetical protein [Desulfobacula toluolica]|uniref:Conserved uncharacterized protein n=1 Tax=Desulfobacula toluolica (strain DSM 7467 / Tol2) TaxID=651182 RepID=K0NHE1_DESTT|nr:hypothetical protein [Desulfobacula toluolica]CCK80701.1 conserved uncharacterized protein [Desulfobacula toluolica Tol2]
MNRISGMIIGSMLAIVCIVIFVFFFPGIDTPPKKDMVSPGIEDSDKLVQQSGRQEIRATEAMDSDIDGAIGSHDVDDSVENDAVANIEIPIDTKASIPLLESSVQDSGTSILSGEKEEPLQVMDEVLQTHEQHIFWGPFQTRTSATGFAEQMEELTGISMAVIDKGGYDFQIAFLYKNEEEKQKNIKLIEEKSHLRIRKSE